MMEINITNFYGIHTGCVHEGGGCNNEIYATKEQARTVCLLLVAEKQDALEQRRSEETDEEWKFYREHPDWEEKFPGYWTDSYDCILIKEFILV